MTVPLLGTAARYFLEVARTGSLTQAATTLHVAPSAISRQISKLEESLDCVLFERRARGMVLSEAGERLAVYARTTAVDAQRAIDEVRGLNRKVAARVRVACTEGFAGGMLTEAMARFHQRHRDCSIHLTTTTPDGVSRMLWDRSADLGLKYAIAPEKGLRIEHQQQAPIVLVVGRQHVLAQRKRIQLAEVLRYPLAMPGPETTLRQMLEVAFSLEGLQCDATFTANFVTLLGLVAHGDALTFAAEPSVADLVRQKRVVTIALPQLRFHLRYLQVLSNEEAPPRGLAALFLKQMVAATTG